MRGFLRGVRARGAGGEASVSPTALTRLIWLLLGVILGSLLSSPVGAQAATRLFATLSSDLQTGGSTPVTCTAAGAGCYLHVQGH